MKNVRITQKIQNHIRNELCSRWKSSVSVALMYYKLGISSHYQSMAELIVLFRYCSSDPAQTLLPPPYITWLTPRISTRTRA